MTLFVWLAAVAAFDLAAGAFDAYETIIGLKKGVALEGNSVINFIAGASKTRVPGAWAVILFNVVRTIAFMALGFIHNPAIIGGAFGALGASAASHIQAGIKWRFLNNGGQIDRSKSYTWWQQLLGMGWD